MKTNAHKVGIIGAILLGGFHTIWSILVFLGVAQAIYDFILWAHMIHIPLIIGPFDIVACISLIIMTSVIGYICGYIGAKVWNRFHQ